MRQPYETLSARARSGETALPRTLLEACGRQRNAKRIFETATSRPVKTFPSQVLRGNLSRTPVVRRNKEKKAWIWGNLALLRHRSISALTWLHISPAQTRTRLCGSHLGQTYEAPRAVQTTFLGVQALDMSSSRKDDAS